MLFQLSVFIALMASIKGAMSATSDFKLYAYGTGIKPGLQLFYADGQAYVGVAAPTFVAEAVNITCWSTNSSEVLLAKLSVSQTEEDTEFIASPDSTTDWASSPTMYIDTTEGSINAVGFVKDNETLGDGSSITGFGLYGGWAFHKSDNSSIQMKFIATPTNETDIYQVKWNAGGTKSDDEVSISLRTQAPAALDD